MSGGGTRTSADPLERLFLLGDHADEGSPGWKILDAIAVERKQRDSLRRQANRVKVSLDKLKEAKAKDKDHDEQVAALSQEREVPLTRSISSPCSAAAVFDGIKSAAETTPCTH